MTEEAREQARREARDALLATLQRGSEDNGTYPLCLYEDEIEALLRALDQPSIYTGAYKGEVVELRLCEYERSFLRPGVLYRFTPGDDCERCQELAEMYED